jgi:DNA-binding MarR family transcriptional regulator
MIVQRSARVPVDPTAPGLAAGSPAQPASSPVPPYRLEEQVGHLMRRAHQRHTAIFQDGLGDCDLTPTQFAALAKIKELGKVTQNLLGRHTAMDPATIQGVVQRLQARGLIQRKPDPADRRVTLLSLTDPGAELAERAIARARDVTRATLEPLDAAERAQLIELLRKLS